MLSIGQKTGLRRAIRQFENTNIKVSSIYDTLNEAEKSEALEEVMISEKTMHDEFNNLLAVMSSEEEKIFRKLAIEAGQAKAVIQEEKPKMQFDDIAGVSRQDSDAAYEESQAGLDLVHEEEPEYFSPGPDTKQKPAETGCLGSTIANRYKQEG